MGSVEKSSQRASSTIVVMADKVGIDYLMLPTGVRLNTTAKVIAVTFNDDMLEDDISERYGEIYRYLKIGVIVSRKLSVHADDGN